MEGFGKGLITRPDLSQFFSAKELGYQRRFLFLIQERCAMDFEAPNCEGVVRVMDRFTGQSDQKLLLFVKVRLNWKIVCRFFDNFGIFFIFKSTKWRQQPSQPVQEKIFFKNILSIFRFWRVVKMGSIFGNGKATFFMHQSGMFSRKQTYETRKSVFSTNAKPTPVFLRDWKVSELESVRIGACQNWSVSELESVRIIWSLKIPYI